MKRWIWYVVGGVFLLALGGVFYGVLAHREQGLMKVCWSAGLARYDGECEELKWYKDQMPLGYYIDFGPEHVKYIDSVIAAADLWNREICRVFDRVDIVEDAAVIVDWGPTAPGEDHSGGYTKHTGNEQVEGARVTLTNPTDMHTVFRYAAHELGHVLGLAHDDSPRSVMHPRAPDTTDKLTQILPSDHDRKLLKQLLCEGAKKNPAE